ncbi:MAG: tetratricopeptide repeat protein [Planctomycetes bacterium]|nr:tetratricopeptide repeat protein [Planctomycetota bacterium]
MADTPRFSSYILNQLSEAIERFGFDETRINRKLLLGTLAAFVLGIPAVHLLHSLQMTKVHRVMLLRVESLREQGQLGSAIELMDKYLRYKPDDIKKRVDLVDLFHQKASSPSEVLSLITLQYSTLGLCESNADLKDRVPSLRRALTDRLIQVGRYEDAIEQIHLGTNAVLDTSIEKQLALSRMGLLLANRPDVVTKYSKISDPEWLEQFNAMHPADLLARSLIDLPGDLELTEMFVELCFGDPVALKDALLAKDSITDLRMRAKKKSEDSLLKLPDSPEAWLLNFRAMSALDQTVSREEVERAADRFSSSPRVQKEAALYFLRLGLSAQEPDTAMTEESQGTKYLARAEDILTSLISSSKSRDTTLYLALGEVLEKKGKLVEAIRVWSDGTRVCTAPTWDLHVRLAQQHLKDGDLSLTNGALQGMDEAIRRETIAFPNAVQNEAQRFAKQQWIAYYLKAGDIAQAERVLEGLRANLATASAMSQANLYEYLGSVYSTLGQWQKAAGAYAEAVSRRPSDDDTLRRASQASIESKLYPQAKKQIESISEKNFMDWVRLASVCLELPVASGATGESEIIKAQTAITNARELMTSDPQAHEREWIVDLLEYAIKLRTSSGEVQRRVIDEATEKLVNLCEANPNKLDMWQTHISALRKWGKIKESNALLVTFQQRNPDSPLAVTFRASTLAAKGEYGEAQRVLLDKLKQSPKNDLVLATLFQWTSNAESLATVADTCVELYKNDLQRLLMIGQLACKASSRWSSTSSNGTVEKKAASQQWSAIVQRIEDRIRALEGDSGTEWRVLRARRLLESAEPNQAAELPIIRDLTTYVIVKKPDYSTGYALEGAVLDRMNELDAAIAMYLKAVGLGEPDIGVYERLTELLYSQGRFDDAQLVMNKLGRGLSRSSRLSSVALQLAASESDQDLAELAKEGVALRPGDPMAWVWYAQVLELTSRTGSREDRMDSIANADEALNRAAEIAPSDLRVFNAQYGFYARIANKEKLESTIERLQGTTGLDLVQKNVVLGRMLLGQGKLLEALASYQAAEELGAKRSSIAILKAEALRSQQKIDTAIEVLDDALQQEPENHQLRRYLSTLLGSRGSVTDWERIEQLLTGSTFANSVDDNRLLASLYIQRGMPSDLIKARRILDKLVVGKSAQLEDDHFRLGLLCLRSAQLQFDLRRTVEGNRLLEDAERYLQQALVISPEREEFLYAYGRVLLKRNRVLEALSQAELLLRLDPDAFSSNLLMACAQKIKGNSNAASGLLKTWQDRMRDKWGHSNAKWIEALSKSALGFLTIQDVPSCDKAISELEAIDRRSAIVALTSISKNEDIETRSSAIDLLLKRGLLAGRDSSIAREIATIIAQAMIEAPFSTDMPSKVHSLLLDVHSTQSNSPRLSKLMAEYWLVTGERSKSIDAYRSLVQSGSKDPVVLNNLANLLSESPDGLDEALQRIDEAIAIAGELPDFLDSKGAILMRMSKLEDAAGMFERASRIGTNPLFKFHWYVALMRAGRTDSALRIKEKIDKSALRRIQLSPDDVEELDKLQ